MVEEIKKTILEELQKDDGFKQKFMRICGISGDSELTQEIKRLEERINTLEDEIFKNREEQTKVFGLYDREDDGDDFK